MLPGPERALYWIRKWKNNCIQRIHFYICAVGGEALGIISAADWTEQFWTAETSRALTLQLAVSVTVTRLYGVGGAGVRSTAVIMEGGMMMINVVTTLNTCSFTVDKNKPKASSRQQNHQRQTSLPNQSNGPPDVVPPGVAEGERKDERIQQLRGNLAAANCKFEAVTIVLKQTLAEVWKLHSWLQVYIWTVLTLFREEYSNITTTITNKDILCIKCFVSQWLLRLMNKSIHTFRHFTYVEFTSCSCKPKLTTSTTAKQRHHYKSNSSVYTIISIFRSNLWGTTISV